MHGLRELLRRRRGSIDNVQTQVSFLQRTLGARNSLGFDIGWRCAKAGSIEQTNRHPAQIDGFFDGITCCAVSVAHNYALVAEEAIEQAGFTSIGRSVDHDPDSVAQNATVIGSCKKRGNLCAN